MSAVVGDTQCEVVLVGCGAPNRGMGWYEDQPKRVVVALRSVSAPVEWILSSLYSLSLIHF
jgi:hypothetical protein